MGVILVFGLAVAAYYYPKAKPAIAAARDGQAKIKQLTAHVSQQDFAKANTDITAVQADIATIGNQLAKMQGLRRWPYIGRQYQAAVNLTNVGHDSTTALTALIDFAAHLFEPFSGRGQVSLATLSIDEKGQLLANIASREDSLKTAQTAIHRAAEDLDLIPEKGLIGPLRKVITPLKQQFPLIAQALDQAIPATHLLPPVLGYPTPKTYLFLLENNTELRPGGGFIGTYGLMKVQSGEIVSLKTDNSYNLDEAAKKLPVITPPEPLQKYLKANAWYFRDANWSPDFPTSAEQALLFYQREGGSKKVDGVLAITPTVISSLLRLVGPITVEKTQFTADNFTDKLQSYVDLGYKYAGQTDSQRKDIIGVLTTDLMNKVLRLPLNQWKDLFLILSQELNEKQVLLYMKDSATQNILVAQNWAGALSQEDATDYLMVVDANLASLKTDPVMHRTYTYTLNLDQATPTATLNIHYENTGKLSWKTTRYNTYVRVYVPAGSTLVSSSGAQKREKSKAAGTVTTTSELGKTVFGAFKSIEPSTSSDLQLTYTLPSSAIAALQSGRYTLTWQKEAGMLPPDIELKINRSASRANSVEGLDNQARISHTAVSFSGRLNRDRTITISY
ncbi:MAG: DUF4012 domain-containing protein [Candidatus Kerfeldbacteria bacterium]|nr:DUF4012 domain-containing protein [Candidatus Kerfeldbacteria bacterium]